MPDPSPTDAAALTLEELRAERMRCRRMIELAQLRARQSPDGAPPALDGLRARYAALTDALIERYAADLALVDSLLEDAYPRGVGVSRDGGDGGSGR